MAQLIVRNLDDAVKEKLKARAAEHGRSLEGEVRLILETAMGELPAGAAKPEKSFGELMHARFSKNGFTDEELKAVNDAVAELKSGSRLRIPDFGE